MWELPLASVSKGFMFRCKFRLWFLRNEKKTTRTNENVSKVKDLFRPKLHFFGNCGSEGSSDCPVIKGLACFIRVSSVSFDTSLPHINVGGWGVLSYFCQRQITVAITGWTLTCLHTETLESHEMSLSSFIVSATLNAQLHANTQIESKRWQGETLC